MSLADVIAGKKDWHVECADVQAALKCLPDGCVHCCVTSPPFYNLRSYLPSGHKDKGKEIGLEDSPAAFVARLVEVFAEVKRVLRDDGCAFVNCGDSYASSGKSGTQNLDKLGEQFRGGGHKNSNFPCGRAPTPNGCKPKDLLLTPWRLFIALQDAGWYVRSIICFAKKTPMPESVTDRFTSSWEPIAMLTKQPRYFYDAEAVRERRQDRPHDPSMKTIRRHGTEWHNNAYAPGRSGFGQHPAGRNMRNLLRADPSAEELLRYLYTHCGEDTRTEIASVLAGFGSYLTDLFLLGPEPLREKHYAAFPSAIPDRCIRAATSQHGCCAQCGSPWERVVERLRKVQSGNRRGPRAAFCAERAINGDIIEKWETTTTGWRPTCSCDSGLVPCVVLDPFCGSGTTGLVAVRLGRRFLGIDLSQEYVDMASRRIERAAEEVAMPLFEQTEDEVQPDLFGDE